MVAVAGTLVRRKARDEHIGTVLAYEIYHIAQDGFLAPEIQRFLAGFRESKIVGVREKLLSAIGAAGGEKFLCANNPYILTLL